jgi:hypothetical protein
MIPYEKLPPEVKKQHDFYAPQCPDHIGSKTVFAGKGIAGIEDAPIDLPVKMLNEVTVNHGVPFSQNAADINM